MKRRLPQYALAFGFAALASGVQAQTAVDRAREGEARQGQIQADSQNLVGQLDAMMDEYQRNALSGEEVKTFQTLRALLSRLTDQEMAKIRTVLQDGVAKNDPQAAIKAIGDAYAAQKGVLGEFKRVLAEHEHNQEALRLSREVNELADRQAAVLQTGIEAAQFSLTNRGSKAAIEASLQAQAAEQKAIGDELKLMREKIEAFTKNEQNKEIAPRMAKGLDQAAKVAPKLEAASQALENKQVFNAVTAQKAARDEMRSMARTIAPPKDEAETLRHAAEQVDKLLAQQKEAIAMAQGGKPQTMPQWAAEQLQNPQSVVSKIAAAKKQFDPEKLAKEKALEWQYRNRMTEKESNLAGLENRQGDLANQTEAVGQEVAAVAKPVADALQAAIPKMQEARAAANAREPEPAAKAMAQALAAMQKAKAELAQRLAAAEQAKGAPGDAVTNLENLQKQAQELMKQQQALAQKPTDPQVAPQVANAAQQAALQQQAQQLQKQAAAAAPAAAPALAKAAANMQQAAAAMQNPAQAAATAPAQQQAMQNLAQANQQVAQQLAQAQAAQAAAAAQQQALTALVKVIIDQQALELETVTAPAKPATEHAVLLALAPRQESVRLAAEELKNPGVPAAAPAPPLDARLLKSATGHMTSAKSALDKAEGKNADPEELLALKDLYALQDTALAQLAAAQANQPAAAQVPAAAAAAAALAQAQAQVAQAAAALAAANPPAGAPPAPGAPGAPAPGGAPGAAMAKAAGQLGGAAATVGAAAAQPGAAPQAAKDAMRQAAAALANAAGQAAANNGPAAQAATADAQQALAQAQSALAQAQAGLSPAGGPPGAPGAPSGQPGAPTPGGPPGAPSPGGIGEGAWSPGGALTAQAGGTVGGKGQFVGLPERDRATIRQAQSEKYPQQYAAEVEQYLRNLSDESTPR